MKRRSISSTLIAVVATMVLSGVALGATFANGGFETGTGAPTSGFRTLNIGSTDISGWTVTSGSIDWIGDYWQAQEGARSIDLDGNDQGAISQTFTTTVNNTYVVEFYLSGNPGGGPALKTLTVQATGGTLGTYFFDTSVEGNTRTDMKWKAQAYSFVATGSTTTLTFASGTVGAFGPALDNVTVTETAATGAQCKKDGWKTMSDHEGNTFKNQGDCVSYYATDTRNLGAVSQ